jgi:hypothetical protein
VAKPPQNLEDVRRKIEQSLSEKLEPEFKPDIVQVPSKRDTGDPLSAIAAQSLSAKLEPEVKPDVVQVPSKQDTGDPLSAIAAARRLTDTCNKTAADIQETGETIVNVAAGIAAETEALAELLRKHGAAIAARIEEFTALTKRVADAVDAARADVSGASAPPLMPSS